MYHNKKHTFFRTVLQRRNSLFLLLALLFCIFLSCLANWKLQVHAQNATLSKGRRILYQDFIPEADPYSTHYYTYNDGNGDHVAFCVEAHKSALSGGSYEIRTLPGRDYALLTAVLAYGYGSPNCKLDEIWPGITANDPDRAYLYTHIAATYAYIVAFEDVTEAEWYKGINTEIAQKYKIEDFIIYCALHPLDYSQSSVNYFEADGNSATQKVAYIGAVSISTDELLGRITLKKQGEVLTEYKDGKFIWEEKGIPGMVFELRAKENITDSFGNLIYAKGALVKTMKTNRKGVAEANNLYPGKYRITEKTASPGYVLDVTPHDLTLSVEQLYRTVTIKNQRQTIDLIVNKKNAENSLPLSGGVFALYNDEDIINIYGDLIVPSGTLLAKASANSEGKIKFALDLPFGKYHFSELQAPTDFYLSDSKLKLNLDYPDPDTSVLKVRHDFFNKPLPHFAYLTLVKAEDTFFLHQTNYQTGEEWEED